MTHWIVAPIVLPAMMAALIVLLAREHLALQRVLSLAATVALALITAGLAWNAGDGGISVYLLGDWQAPFGIVLVADRLSTTFTLLTGVLAVIVLLYAVGSGWDGRGRHFHALYQFQLMGIMGAFLTGDAFNLFVFFEVLLIASYGLMLHSGGTERYRAGVQYVVYNLLGSTLFLFALGAIYAELGTLNMAHLAQRMSEATLDDSSGLRVAAVLLLLVFAVKAAILPLHFWLPSAYAHAPAPVAALFAVMTKVGAYGIIRFYTLVFPPDLEVTQGLFDTWLLPGALLTLALGMVGVLGSRHLDRLVAFAVIGSMGMLMASIATFTEKGITAALYYAIHSTLATAALFLLVDVVRDRREAPAARLTAAPPIQGGALIAGMFFVAAIAMTGLPPLSGFLGKLMILEAAAQTPALAWVWAVVLGSSLLAVVGFARAGSTVFWKGHQVAADRSSASDPEEGQGAHERHDPPARPPVLPLVAIGALLALLVAVTVLAGPINRYLAATTAQLFAPEPYIAAVLEKQGKEIEDHHGDEEGEEAEAAVEHHTGGAEGENDATTGAETEEGSH